MSVCQALPSSSSTHQGAQGWEKWPQGLPKVTTPSVRFYDLSYSEHTANPKLSLEHGEHEESKVTFFGTKVPPVWPLSAGTLVTAGGTKI